MKYWYTDQYNHSLMIKKSLLLLVCLAFITVAGYGQRSSVYDEPDATYRQALELFNKQQYGAARKLFLQVVENSPDPADETGASALFYAGLSAMELFHPDAEAFLMTFINDYSTHPRQNMARFELGNLKYRDRRYQEALGWYAQVNHRPLKPARQDEYNFKKGYSHLMTEDPSSARQLMAQVQDPGSLYFAPATYYYGHIAYLQQDYQTALEAFDKLTDDRNFGAVVPYYVTHIYFLQKRYDELLAYAPPLLEEASPRRGPEISRLIGEAYFLRGDYQQAIPFLETYISQARTQVTREDHYQMGFSYYSTGQPEKAIRHFERVTSENDLLSQNAWYHLASCFLQTNQKRFARNAFQSAYQMNYDRNIAQDALFNYAKMSFELSLDPYNEAILSFQRYIDNYPDGERIEEAYQHLVDLFLTTRNYKDALSSIEKIPINNSRMRAAHQRIAYYRGIELFNNGDYSSAIEHLDKSRRHPENRSLAALSLYWKGESYYRLEQYDQALEAHAAFLVSPGAFSLPQYNRAHYSTGYSHFKKQNYRSAITAFRKFLADNDQEKRLQNDASLRVADSYFITKNYPLALEYYDQAIRQNALDTDYAIFQKALVQGVTGNYEQKNATLNNLLSRFPETTLAADAKFELANTHLILNNNPRALSYFNQVITQHPNSSYVKNAMLKTGLVHYNDNDDAKALEIFKKVVNQYPGSAESQEALVSIRNIYVSLDQVDEFVSFTQGLGFANISTAQQDSLTYMAAENRYMQGDCQNATRSLANYIERYPNGIFAINAHFYKAECDFRLNNTSQALSDYRYVISRPRSKFTENALFRASQIEYSQNNYDAAYNYFVQLEQVAESRGNILDARVGQMRTLYRLERNQEAAAAAGKVIGTDKVSREITQEAWLIMGNTALEENNMDQAREAFSQVISLSENQNSAEAMYNMALIDFREGKYEAAEQKIFEYIKKMSAYDYWLAKTFILLADTYMETDNIFQARHTLESIIENYQGEELRAQAQSKLDKIIAMEEMEDTPSPPDTLEIEMETGDL